MYSVHVFVHQQQIKILCDKIIIVLLQKEVLREKNNQCMRIFPIIIILLYHVLNEGTFARFFDVSKN